MDQFQKEQNELLQYMINVFKKNFANQKDNSRYGIELFITPVCNQKCSYCYLVKHGEQLYPKEIRNKETILSNLEILLDYFRKEMPYIPRIDLFSGEIWGMEFGNQVFDRILKALEKGLKIKDIMIPTNASFMTNPKIAKLIAFYKEQFAKFHCNLRMSASVDGLLVEAENRPFKIDGKTETLKDQQYYDVLMKQFFEHGWGFHPMIDAYNIEKQKDNYIWWQQQFDKFGYTKATDWFNYIMMLEVRNDSWTEDKIKSYLDWLNFIMDYDLNKYFNGHEIEFIYDIILGNRYADLFDKNHEIVERTVFDDNFRKLSFPYVPYTISSCNQKAFGCSLGTLLGIRLGDLALMPCHRTAYPKFMYGNYIIENNKITGIHANNPFLFFNIMGQGSSLLFKCDTCILKDVCMKGCLGSQYETTKDMLFPIDSVCNLNFAKFIFIYNKFMYYLDLYKLEENYELHYSILTTTMNNLKEKYPEETQKWQQIVKQIIQK